MEQLRARVAVLEELVAKYQEREATDERLLAAVQALAAEASGVHEVLDQVDQQQQRLSDLSHNIESKANKTDVTNAAQVVNTQRRKAIVRMSLAVLLAFITLIGIGSIYVGRQNDLREAQYQSCVGAQYAGKQIENYVNSQIKIAQMNKSLTPEVRDATINSYQALQRAFPAPTKCEKKT